MKNITFDWVRTTFKSSNHLAVIEQICSILTIPLSDTITGEPSGLWEDCNGAYNYKNGLKFDIGFSEKCIYIYWDNLNNPESIMLEMSGSCCRFFDDYIHWSWKEFLGKMREVPSSKFTRVDVCADDTEKLKKDDNIEIEHLAKKLDKQHYYNTDLKKKRTHDKVQSRRFRNSYDEPIEGTTLYVGSRKAGSEQFLRIYDKRAEQLGKGNPCEHEKWIRYEMVYAGDKANQFVDMYIESDNEIGKLYSASLNHFITFTTNRGTEWRAWTRLINTMEYVKIPSKRRDITIMNKKEWIEKNASKNFAIVAKSLEMSYEEYGRHLGRMGEEKISKVELLRIELFKAEQRKKGAQ